MGISGGDLLFSDSLFISVSVLSYEILVKHRACGFPRRAGARFGQVPPSLLGRVDLKVESAGNSGTQFRYVSWYTTLAAGSR